MSTWLVNDGPRWLVICLWLATNFGLFLGFFLKFYENNEYYYLRKLLLAGALGTARGAAACLNFNCMLVLFPVCRNLISLFRGSCRCTPQSVRRLLDKNITFHIYIASAIVMWAAVHAGAHMFNYLYFSTSWSKIVRTNEIVVTVLPSGLNPVSQGQDESLALFSTVAGITGVVLLICLFLMVTSSIEIMRRSFFEVFWYTHHLFVVFFVALIVHGIQGIVKGQSNPESIGSVIPNAVNYSHQDPVLCYAYETSIFDDVDCQNMSCLKKMFGQQLENYCNANNAVIESGGAKTWQWVVVPLAFYLLERLVRFCRTSPEVIVMKVLSHPSQVLEIQMRKRGFQAVAGQYVFIQVPAVSFFEWHPFTLTSSPEEDYFSVHIRVVGDWTEEVATLCGMGNDAEFQARHRMPSIFIDGPFGTCSEDIFRYEVGVAIGTGIGVTPFASILKSCWYQSLEPKKHERMMLKKIYFFWICPETEAFEWFQSLLSSLEEQMLASRDSDFIEYNIYLTRGWDHKTAHYIYMKEEEHGDAITGLQQKTKFGRPNWDEVFSEIARQQHGKDIGVFYCGPKALSRTLHKKSNEYSTSETRFFYNKETRELEFASIMVNYNWIINDGPRFLFLFLWLGTNVGLYIGFHLKFAQGSEFYYLRKVLLDSLAVARGSAACLNFNCMLVLFPVCRNLISMFRGSCRCTPRSVRRLLDKNITIHIYIALVIVLWTAVHTGSHMFNYRRFVTSWNLKREGDGATIVSLLPDGLNPVTEPGNNESEVLFTTIAGITGFVIIICLFLMVTSSIEIMRRSFFEVFWYTHHLFVVFFVALIIHGIQGLVQGQTNSESLQSSTIASSDEYLKQDPVVCYAYNARTFDDVDQNSSEAMRAVYGASLDDYCNKRWGKVAPGGAQTWKWVVVPLVLYLIERLVRFFRARQEVVVTKVVSHPSKVLEIQLKRKGFHSEAGQYVFIQVPEIRLFEWHPFTLTSSPEEDYFSVHIRSLGDWTEKVAKRCGVGVDAGFQHAFQMPKILIDGPFGTCSEDIFKHEVGVAVGAGIGVTPFASILKSCWYQSLDPNTNMKLKKVYFFWICSEPGAFEWFQSLLASIEDQMMESGNAEFIEFHIHLTRGWDFKTAQQIYMQEENESDVLTGLQQKTIYGRPNWDEIFPELARKHPKVDIGVFFCGPKVLSQTLHKKCNEHSTSSTRFLYNKENFFNLLGYQRRKAHFYGTMSNWVVNEGPKWLIMFLWIGTNVGLYFGFHFKFELGINYYILRKVLFSALAVARGSAACLNFNCMLILFPVCRNLISLFRGTCRCTPRSVRRVLDKNLTFHKWIAWAIAFHTALHTGSHMFNYKYFISAYDLRGSDGQPVLGLVSPDFNPVKTDLQDPVTVMWTTIAGITGHIIIICLFLMITSSIDIMRRSYYEVFWYTHHLFVIFFVCFVIHGIQGLVKGHTNTETIFTSRIKFDLANRIQTVGKQDPVLCYAAATGYLNDVLGLYNTSQALTAALNTTFIGLLEYCDESHSDVKSGGAQSWKWVVVPLFFYLVERVLRVFRSSRTVAITKVIAHPSKVLEIQMKKKGFHADTAQYVFMCVPEIRYFEWHAFTLSSSPEEDYFSVHIRQVGDWTTELAKRCGVDSKNPEFQQSYHMPKILIDGPFGTPSEDIFKYEVGVAVGGGIGVTPFASVLKSVWYQLQQADTDMKLKKVYFYWICPDTKSFEWFRSLLQHLEEQMFERGHDGFIQYHIYLTRGFSTAMVRDVYMHEEAEGDAITGLQQKTRYGRPNWDQIFPNLASNHPNTDVGVFFCGPPVLSAKLHRKCNEYTNATSKNGTRFYYNKENF
ncbi:uncharacterized protein LOC134187231 [Corticium candelabrum]|uniref:uncharacterized protein LOC134187231 n=1 Tax=Corticium candelabrum TaxID=121492 RepID=UPI002E264DAC|nr:uncharacterized protein LOC134187231 [Corticium candelabrum]